ncbi:unnamed protein product [Amoebophrya sp. A25]|nr:unnamed protein product [Amoebophrya sp. A25]|eukprot:GSA25T00018852001.1
MGHKSNPYKKARSAFRWKIFTVEEEAHASFAEEEEEDEAAQQVIALYGDGRAMIIAHVEEIAAWLGNLRVDGRPATFTLIAIPSAKR